MRQMICSIMQNDSHGILIFFSIIQIRELADEEMLQDVDILFE